MFLFLFSNRSNSNNVSNPYTFGTLQKLRRKIGKKNLYVIIGVEINEILQQVNGMRSKIIDR